MNVKYLKFAISTCLLISQLTIFSTVTFGKGGVLDGGGGDAVMLQNDNIILADPFVKVDDSEESEVVFSSALKQEVLSMINMMVQCKGNRDNLYDSILSEKNIFYSVLSIPDREECRNRLSYPSLQKGAVVLQVACTINRETWIREDLFKKMNLQEQGLLIIHEGLRRKNLADTNITNITNGLRITFKNLQAQLNSDYTKIADSEKSELKKFIKSTLLASWDYTNDERKLLNYIKSYTISDHGGLIKVSKAGQNIDPAAVIGIGTIVGDQISIGKNSSLLMTNLCEKSDCRIGANVKIIRAMVPVRLDGIPRIEIGNESSIMNSEIGFVSGISIDDGASVLDSSVFIQSIELKKDAKIQNVIVKEWIDQLVVRRGVFIRNFSILNVEKNYEFNLFFKTNILGDNFICKTIGSGFAWSRKNYTIDSFDELKELCH